MEQKHSKEPWKWSLHCGAFMATVNDENIGGTFEVKDIPGPLGIPGENTANNETARANVQRIVSCVNALAGIKKPEFFVNDLLGLVRFLSGKLDEDADQISLNDKCDFFGHELTLADMLMYARHHYTEAHDQAIEAEGQA